MSPTAKVPPGDRLVVLVSGAGTTLQALLDAAAAPGHLARVVAVVSDRDGVGALARATSAGVPHAVVVPSAHADRETWDRALADAVARHAPDLVVCAGFMRILGPGFLARFPDRVVNTHPALLPSFPGTHGVRDALAYGVKVAGCTVHLVDAGVDTGPIVAQATVPVLTDDDVDTLNDRIKAVERPLLVDVVGRMVRDGWSVPGRKVTIP